MDQKKEAKVVIFNGSLINERSFKIVFYFHSSRESVAGLTMTAAELLPSGIKHLLNSHISTP